MKLKEIFIELLNKYSENNILINNLWEEIEKYYSDKKRYYHNFTHLENSLLQLIKVKNEIKDWDTILFTLFYHDIIYNVEKSDNEEKSAKLAEKHLNKILVPKDKIELCKSQIISTKLHLNSMENDTNYFLDADISILGQDSIIYKNYYKNIRKEYSIYDDSLYNKGREKVLNNFLNKDRIFKTDYFYNYFEINAKINIINELKNY